MNVKYGQSLLVQDPKAGTVFAGRAGGAGAAVGTGEAGGMGGAGAAGQDFENDTDLQLEQTENKTWYEQGFLPESVYRLPEAKAEMDNGGSTKFKLWASGPNLRFDYLSLEALQARAFNLAAQSESLDKSLAALCAQASCRLEARIAQLQLLGASFEASSHLVSDQISALYAAYAEFEREVNRLRWTGPVNLASFIQVSNQAGQCLGAAGRKYLESENHLTNLVTLLRSWYTSWVLPWPWAWPWPWPWQKKAEGQGEQNLLASFNKQNLIYTLAQVLEANTDLTAFTLGTRRYERKDFSPVAWASVYLNWFIARMARQLGRRGHDIAFVQAGTGLDSSPGASPVLSSPISVPNILDSPELNQQLEDDFIAFTGADLENRKKIDQAVKALESEDYFSLAGQMAGAGSSGGQLLLMALATKFFADQEKERTKRLAVWEKTKTGRLLGAGASRLAPRPLAPPVASTVKPLNPGRVLPRSLTQILRYSDYLDPYEGAALEIQSWKNQEGKPAYRVLLRGTESWDAGSVQSQDMASNLAAVAQIPSTQLVGVKAAMEAAGIQPGDPVQIFGHSQAGIIASQIAQEAGRDGHFNVVSVVTVASPTGGYRFAPDTQAVHVENLHDAVPALDGVYNPATPSRLTLYLDAEVSSPHDRSSYRQILAGVEGKTPVFDAAWERANHRLYLDSPIQEIYTQRYEFRRVEK